MVCSPHNSVVMERNTDVDEVVELSAGAAPREFGKQFRGGLDLAIALAPRSDDITLVGSTRAKKRVGYTYVRRYMTRLSALYHLTETMLSEADPELADRNPQLRVRHEVDQLLDLVALAGATQRVASLRLDVSDDDRAALEYLPKDPLVMHLGARWFRGGSTLESTIEVVRALGRFGLPVAVTYAPECEQYIERIAEARVADVLLGGLPFFRWAAVFERAKAIVTVDTGATHVASAMRRPTVVVFEHRYFRLNSQEWSPYGVPSVLVRKPIEETQASLARLRGEIVDGVAELLHA